MALLSSIFKADDVVEDSLLPAGNYLCEITKSAIKETKAKTGKYLSLHISIIDGDHAGNLVFDNLNIENPNPKAVQIAKRKLKQLCEAISLDELEDTAELHGVPFTANIKVKDASGGWPAKNEVNSYMGADEYEEE